MPRSAQARALPLPQRQKKQRPQRQPTVWLLMGGRTGDNNQLLALAKALGFPFETKKLSYNTLKRLPVRRSGLATLKGASRASISAPWPGMVMCVGYASVPVARYIREQSKGRTKLVHIGNPRVAIEDFDLQITTPQYPREARNLLELPFPIGNPARTSRPSDEELEWLHHFPHPRRLIAVGGPARHWDLDEGTLREAVRTLSGKERGSLIIATSPRTRSRMLSALQNLIRGHRQVVVESFPSFGTLLSQCQEVYVTADSVSMLSEAVLSGRPVGMIPIRRSLLGKLSYWLYERPLGRSTKPDLRNFWNLLKSRQLVGTVDLPVAAQVCDTVERAADAVRSVLAAGDVVDEERR